MEEKDLGIGEGRGRGGAGVRGRGLVRGVEALCGGGDIRCRRRQILFQKIDRLFSIVAQFSKSLPYPLTHTKLRRRSVGNLID